MKMCLLRIFTVLVMVTNLFGCRLVRIGLATLRSTAHFVSLESDKRVLDHFIFLKVSLRQAKS